MDLLIRRSDRRLDGRVGLKSISAHRCLIMQAARQRARISLLDSAREERVTVLIGSRLEEGLLILCSVIVELTTSAALTSPLIAFLASTSEPSPSRLFSLAALFGRLPSPLCNSIIFSRLGIAIADAGAHDWWCRMTFAVRAWAIGQRRDVRESKEGRSAPVLFASAHWRSTGECDRACSCTE